MKKYKLPQTEKAFEYWRKRPDTSLYKIADKFKISYYTIQQYITEKLIVK